MPPAGYEPTIPASERPQTHALATARPLGSVLIPTTQLKAMSVTLPAVLINIHILLDVTLSVDIHHAEQRNNPEDINVRRNKG